MYDDFEENFIIPQSLGAMAKTFYVKAAKPVAGQENLHLKPGSTVTGVKVIASGEEIREVERLIRDYPLPNGEKTKSKDWYKVRGTAVVTDGVTESVEEVHWYQCKDIGKVEYKQKF